MAKALEDVKVLDLTTWESGPVAAMMMGFLGADVVKVEPPGVGDPARHFSTVPLAPGVDSFYYIYFNLNKKGITLNLDKAKGVEILKEMVKKFDVLVENYEGGTMENWGLSYDVLKEINPGLIYARISGYGSYGPYANYPCVDATAQAMAGIYSWTGWPDKPPVKPAPSIGEIGAGVNLFAGILMALHEKVRTGKGQFVEVTMADSCVNLTRVALSFRQAEKDQLFRGDYTKRAGIAASTAPSSFYPTQDDDAYITFMFGNAQRQWDTLLKTVGHPELIGDPRFADQDIRGKNQEVVDKLIADWTSKQPGVDAFNTLASAGVSTGITLTSTQAMSNPHVIARQKVVELEHPVRGKYKTLGYAANLEKSPVEVTNAPLLGQHNAQVYADVMGYGKADLAKLKEVGVI